MKKLWILAACLLLLTGCAQTAPQDTGWNLADTTPEAITTWPENEFTAQIPQPQAGTPDYVLDSTSNGRYAVFLRGISMEDSAAYVDLLKLQGYAEVAGEGNDVSVGTLLQKGRTCLSIAYTDGELGILIAKK